MRLKLVVGIGELLWDVFPDEKRLGGAPANFAYWARQLGCNGVVISRIGDDAGGKEILESLRRKGVPTDHLQIDPEKPTGRVNITMEGTPHTFEIVEDVAWDRLEFTPEMRDLAAQTDGLCFGTLAQRSHQSRRTIEKFLDHTSGAVKVCDLNLRQEYYSPELIECSLRHADILKLNEEEVLAIEKMFRINQVEIVQWCRAVMAKFGLSIVCVTRGERGALLVNNEDFVDQAGIEVEVADTVGAGDAFTAAMLNAVLMGRPLKAVALDAVKLGAYVASRSGAMPTFEPSELPGASLVQAVPFAAVSEGAPRHGFTCALIDLEAIAENFQKAQGKVGPNVEVMAVVKADAYGHGAVPVARRLVKAGAKQFAVATPDEALELRESGIREPILILGSLLPEQIRPLLGRRIAAVLNDADQAREFARIARENNSKLSIHLKVDTGMGRLGILQDEAVGLAVEIASTKNLRFAGILTHFPSSDESKREFTLGQIGRFEEICEELRGRGVDFGVRHAANSAAVIDYPESYFDMVRPGLMLYGLYPSPEVSRDFELQPAMRVTSRITLLKRVEPGWALSYGRAFRAPRRMLIAIVPIGYADGYPRVLSNRGKMVVRGKRVPVVGLVCMDQIILDVTDVEGVSVGDVVCVFGPGGIAIEEIAECIGSIPHELVSGLGKRVARDFFGGV